MRLKFESEDLEPLGEGGERKTFINPEDVDRVISVKKEGVEKDTPRQLKGRYYLTKIAHLLLPNHIPDIFQVRESSDGVQTIDTERISHTPGHKLVQETLRSGGDGELARKELARELGKEKSELVFALSDLGFGFNIDEYLGNFTKDEKGNVYYLETFSPWQEDVEPGELEALFDEEVLREAIGQLPDQETRETCMRYLERLLVLFEEEKLRGQESQEHRIGLIDSDLHITELEAILAPFLEEGFLGNLHSFKTEEEARGSELRKSAQETLVLILEKLRFLKGKTNISPEEYDRLHSEYKTLSRAVGIVNGGVVDHNI